MLTYENLIKLSLIIIAIIVISILLIKRFMYFRPSSNFIPYKESYQDISEGNLHGWFLQGNNNIVILYCHGNAGNISNRQPHIDNLNDMGYSVLIFDYGGYGRSKGIPSESQFYHDASVFMRILLKTYNKKNIVLYSESIGTPVAAHIALKYKINTLIIDSGLPSIKKYIRNKIGFLGWLSFLFPEFDTEKYLKNYTGKILVMHSPTDEIIPYKITNIVRSYATHSIDLQGTHNNHNIPWNEVDMFIQKSKTTV
jgi:hypothetical protein